MTEGVFWLLIAGLVWLAVIVGKATDRILRRLDRVIAALEDVDQTLSVNGTHTLTIGEHNTIRLMRQALAHREPFSTQESS